MAEDSTLTAVAIACACALLLLIVAACVMVYQMYRRRRKEKQTQRVPSHQHRSTHSEGLGHGRDPLQVHHDQQSVAAGVAASYRGQVLPARLANQKTIPVDWRIQPAILAPNVPRYMWRYVYKFEKKSLSVLTGGGPAGRHQRAADMQPLEYDDDTLPNSLPRSTMSRSMPDVREETDTNINVRGEVMRRHHDGGAGGGALVSNGSLRRHRSSGALDETTQDNRTYVNVSGPSTTVIPTGGATPLPAPQHQLPQTTQNHMVPGRPPPPQMVSSTQAPGIQAINQYENMSSVQQMSAQPAGTSNPGYVPDSTFTTMDTRTEHTYNSIPAGGGATGMMGTGVVGTTQVGTTGSWMFLSPDQHQQQLRQQQLAMQQHQQQQFGGTTFNTGGNYMVGEWITAGFSADPHNSRYEYLSNKAGVRAAGTEGAVPTPYVVGGVEPTPAASSALQQPGSSGAVGTYADGVTTVSTVSFPY